MSGVARIASMAIGEFQRALADMTLDPRLAAAVRSNGTAALEDYSLTEREERRLETVARQNSTGILFLSAKHPEHAVRDEKSAHDIRRRHRHGEEP